jgi:hypothetical protein
MSVDENVVEGAEPTVEVPAVEEAPEVSETPADAVASHNEVDPA